MDTHPHAAHAGRQPLIHGAGTDNEHIRALDRFPLKLASPEQPFTAPVRGAALSEALEAISPLITPDDQALLDEILVAGPAVVFDQLHSLTDVPFGGDFARALLADNGLLPETATLQEADDLLAVAYAGEEPDQWAMRRLRAVGALIAAGEDVWTVLSCVPRCGPTSDFYAIDVAVRAGQAEDAADPRVAAMPKPWVV